MDPLQWMGAVRMRVQKADKNITIFHTIPVIGYHCYYHEAKSCLFIINKFNIKMFLTSNQCFQLNYESSICYIAFSSENVISAEEICMDQASFSSKNGPKQL